MDKNLLFRKIQFHIFFTLYFFFLCTSQLTAQAPLLWSATFGNKGIDRISAMTVDGQGNIYVAGNFDGEVDFDPGFSYHGLNSYEWKMFIAKYDATGKLVWATPIGGDKEVNPEAIAVNGQGVFVLSSGKYFLTMLDLQGKIYWTKPLNGNSTRKGSSLALDPAGNLYITGEFGGTADFDLSGAIYNLTTKGDLDIFVMKIDVYGDFIWAARLGGPGNVEGANSLTLDQEGNVVITGFFEEGADFDPKQNETLLSSNGGSDLFVCKLDPAANLIWVKTLGTSTPDQDANAIISADNSVLLAGAFRQSLDFDPGAGEFFMTAAEQDAFLLKLDKDGKFIWVKRIGGEGDDKFSALSITPKKEIVLAGNFQSMLDFDPADAFVNFSAKGEKDGFILQLTSEGDFSCAGVFGGQSSIINPVAINGRQNSSVVLAGSYSGNFDSDATLQVRELQSKGLEDMFLIRLGSCADGARGVVTIPGMRELRTYPNPSDGHFTLQAPSDNYLTEVKIYNNYGEEIFGTEIKLGRTYAFVNIPDVKGVFLVKAKTDKGEVLFQKIFLY